MLTDPNRVKEIFLEAAEQPDEAARIAYLDRACGGDAGLRDRVEVLLRSHDPAGSFLGTPAAVVPDPNRGDTMALDPTPGPGPTRDGDGKPRPEQDEESDDLQFLSPSTRPDSLGRLGHYEMLQVLGRGGFGIVFRAFDDILQRVVAVKVMAPQIATLSPARKRFLREARSSAAVRHENVVQVYEVGEQPLPYLVMEFVPGETLQQKLDRSGPLEVSEVLRIGRQIAEGLAAAHACDLIHRDIKPGNILLEGGSHHVKITDFGLARAADDASISQSGVIAGTPMFMAPEQALGHKIDQRADLFSLGSVLYQMVSGRPPFRAPSALAVLKRVAEEPPRPIPEIIPETPEWLCDIITKLHAKRPAERFQTAEEVAELLGLHLAELQQGRAGSVSDRSRTDAPVPASPVAHAPGSPRRRSPLKRGVALAAGLLMLLVGAVGTIAVLMHNTNRTTNPEDTKPVVDVGKQNGPAIDLIPLARPDPALGNWKREGDTLVCTARGDLGYQTLPIPVELPREYELEAVLERLAGDEVIGFMMEGFGSKFYVAIDAWPDKGSWSGLGTIEKKMPWENETGIRGAQISIGKHYTFRCTVRASGIVATLDDKLLFNYIGGFDKLDRANFLDVRGAKLYVVVLGTVGCQVHRLRLTQLAPEDKTNALPPAVTPFVVLAGKGQPQRSFATLKDAVDKATSGDTIEIRGNGPFRTAPIEITEALTLRAGAGYRPVLVHTTDGSLLLTTAPLALEGLEFRSFGNKQKPKESQWALIGAYATSLRITHCRIVVAGGLSAIWSWNSPSLEVKDSEIFSTPSGIDIGATNRGRYVIQNCCMGRSLALGLFESDRPLPKPARDAEVELIDNTFVSVRKIWANRFFRDPLDSGKEDFRSVHFQAVGNVFQSRLRFGVVEDWDNERPFRPDAFADWYRAHVAWEARDNLFTVNGDFLVFTEFDDGRHQEMPWKTSKDWQTFWKVDKAPGIEGNPRFVGGDLFERLQKEPLSLTAADFRLEKGGPGQGAGPDGRDLGADVDKVGPGEPYERWKTTPEYQEWVKKSEELMSRP